LHPIDVIEIRESRNRDAGRRMIEESIALTESIPEAAAVTVLDGRGESLSSEALAARLRRWQEGGRGAITFIIGGPDGLADSLRDRAQLRLAFGTATWPHQMVRIMLLEQLYRATTILSGHPYHRQ
jgi:23S rRNA (pseudouridine1915-N3)-methyltransferase